MGQAEENRGKIREGSCETKKMRNREKQESGKVNKEMKTPMETEAKWVGVGGKREEGKETKEERRWRWLVQQIKKPLRYRKQTVT